MSFIDSSTFDTHPRQRRQILDAEMSCADVGHGHPVVFLHGNPTSSYLWRNVIPFASGLSRCLAAGARIFRRGCPAGNTDRERVTRTTLNAPHAARLRCVAGPANVCTRVYNYRNVSETRLVNPPVPRVWIGLAFFFGIATTFVITRTLENWTELVPAPENVPLATQRVLLTLEMMLLGVAIQAIWWLVRVRSRTHA